LRCRDQPDQCVETVCSICDVSADECANHRLTDAGSGNARRNFGFGTIAATMLGFALFGSVYILPAYLGQAQGYNAEQIGKVLAWTGLPQLILIPLVPRLMQRFDSRYIAS
jgi:hypothetical protein